MIVRNVSDELVLVGERYLFPTQSREVDERLINRDDPRLEIVASDEPAVVEQPKPTSRRRRTKKAE